MNRNNEDLSSLTLSTRPPDILHTIFEKINVNPQAKNQRRFSRSKLKSSLFEKLVEAVYISSTPKIESGTLPNGWDGGMYWPRIFYKRLFKYKTLLTEMHANVLRQHVQSFMKDYLNPKHYRDKKNPPHFREHTSILTTLIEYLRTHRQCPDNAVIGLYASNNVVRNLALQARRSSSDGLGSKEELLRRIIMWSGLNDKDLITAVRTTASGLKTTFSSILVETGDIVLVKKSVLKYPPSSAEDSISLYSDSESSLADISDVETDYDNSPPQPDDFLVYCRVKATYPDVLLVASDHYEEIECTVPRPDIIFSPPFIHQRLNTANSIDSIILNPVDLVFKDIDNFVNKLVTEYLQTWFVDTKESMFDLSILARAKACEVSLNDLSILKMALDKFRLISDFSLHNEKMRTLLELINVYASKAIYNFKRSLKHHKIHIFVPSSTKAVSQLDTFNFDLLARSRFHCHQGCLECAVELLETEKFQILSGAKKKMVTDWYLRLIRESVNGFLSSKGFHLKAIPDDYTFVPPPSMSLVKSNLTILQSLFSNNPELPQFIDGLKDIIYDKLNLFAESIESLLKHEFGVDGTPQDIDLVQDNKIENYWKLHETRFGKSCGTEEARTFANLVKDIEYITRVKDLEKSKKKIPSDAVPISGLIMSCFLRFENELQTIVSLWGAYSIEKEEKEQREGEKGKEKTPEKENEFGNPEIIKKPHNPCCTNSIPPTPTS